MGKTHVDSRYASMYVVDVLIASSCNELEPVSFEEAQKHEHWIHPCRMSTTRSLRMALGFWLICIPARTQKWSSSSSRQMLVLIYCDTMLVAKVYAQQKGIDYDETFAPTSRVITIRSIFVIARWNAY